MLKRVIYLVAVLWIMMLCTAFAEEQKQTKMLAGK